MGKLGHIKEEDDHSGDDKESSSSDSSSGSSSNNSSSSSSCENDEDKGMKDHFLAMMRLDAKNECRRNSLAPI